MKLAPDAAWCTFVVVCSGAAAANFAAWATLLVQAPTAIAAAVAVLAACLAGRWAWLGLRRGSGVRGELAWDGAIWHWAVAPLQPATGEVRVMVDLGAWMLLRFVSDASPPQVAWLALSRRHGGALWPLWRAALFSRRPDAEPSVAADPS